MAVRGRLRIFKGGSRGGVWGGGSWWTNLKSGWYKRSYTEQFKQTPRQTGGGLRPKPTDPPWIRHCYPTIRLWRIDTVELQKRKQKRRYLWQWRFTTVRNVTTLARSPSKCKNVITRTNQQNGLKGILPSWANRAGCNNGDSNTRKHENQLAHASTTRFTG